MPPNFWERKNRRAPRVRRLFFVAAFYCTRAGARKLPFLKGCVFGHAFKRNSTLHGRRVAVMEGCLRGKRARTPACRGFRRLCLFGRKVRCPQEAVRGVPLWWEACSTELGGALASLYLPFPWRNHCGFSSEGTGAPAVFRACRLPAALLLVPSFAEASCCAEAPCAGVCRAELVFACCAGTSAAEAETPPPAWEGSGGRAGVLFALASGFSLACASPVQSSAPFAPCARFHAKMSASRAANRASNPCVVGR